MDTEQITRDDVIETIVNMGQVTKQSLAMYVGNGLTEDGAQELLTSLENDGLINKTRLQIDPKNPSYELKR
jgi:hypothetical protein